MKTASLQMYFGNNLSSSFVCVFICNSTLETSIFSHQLGVTGPDKAKMADNFIPTLVVIYFSMLVHLDLRYHHNYARFNVQPMW